MASGFGGFSGTRAITGQGGGGQSEAELNKALLTLIMTLQQRANDPNTVDPNAILQRSFPQPPAQSFRPSSGQFGQNAASFSNVSSVPGQGDRRLANTGSTIINIIRAIQAAKQKKPGGGGGGGGSGRNISEILGRLGG